MIALKSGRFSLPTICAAILLLTVTAAVGQTADTSGMAPVPFFDRPIDSDTYLIRPGEQLEVVFINSQLAPLALKVDAESRIVHQKLGIFELSGRTLSETRDLLLEPLSRLYNAQQIDIAITKVYPVSIRVSGAVTRPGRYVGYTSQRVSDIIDSAGGIAPGGSRRDISLISEDRTLAVDLDRAEYHGDYKLNPNLYAGNRIHVPAVSGGTVYVTGEVNEPRSIELLPGDDLELLVALAGGVKPEGNIEAAYILGDSTRDLRANGSLKPGDFVVIPRGDKAAEDSDLTVLGAVGKPGRYDWSRGISIDDLLASAGGLSPKANPHRIIIFRRTLHEVLGTRLDERYPLSLGSLETDGGFALEPSDSVVVASLVGFVRVRGSVPSPGVFPFQPGKDAGYYLSLAGGAIAGPMGVEIRFRENISGLERSADRRDPVYDGLEIIVRQKEPGQ